MRRVLLGAALSALLLTGAATGQSTDQPTTADSRYDRQDDSGKWGLLGLVGLLGLMGLKKKDEVVRTSATLREGTSTAR